MEAVNQKFQFLIKKVSLKTYSVLLSVSSSQMRNNSTGENRLKSCACMCTQSGARIFLLAGGYSMDSELLAVAVTS